MMLRSTGCLLIAAAMLMISACTFTENVETALFDHRTSNLKENAYAVADMLAQQTKVHMPARARMIVTIPTDTKAPDETTAFGEELAAHLGARFIQLGYNVQSVEQADPDMIFASSQIPHPTSQSMQPIQMGADPTTGGAPAFLGGTYTRTDDRVLVNLKIVQKPDGRLIAAYDYSLPLTPDLKNLTLTRAEWEMKEKYPVGTFLGLSND